jgi:hypothetical protein
METLLSLTTETISILNKYTESLRSTTVIPLTKIQTVTKIFTKLTPIVEVHGTKHLAMTQQIAGLDRTLLGKPVDDLDCAYCAKCLLKICCSVERIELNVAGYKGYREAVWLNR